MSTSCDETRQALRTASTRSFPELTHLASCGACRALADAILDQEQAMHTTIDEWLARGEPKARRRAWPWVTVLVALAAGGALWLAARATPPTPPPEATPPSQAVPPPVPAEPAVGGLQIARGTGLVVTLPQPATEVVVADPTRVATTWLGEGRSKLYVSGVAEGESMLTVRFAEGLELAYLVEVGPAPTEVPDDHVRLALGAERTFPLREPPIAMVTSSPEVVGIEARGDQLVVRGRSAGVTDVVVQYASGPPAMFLVHVSE